MPRADRRLPVWDRCVRSLHWILALAAVCAWLTVWGFSRLHEAAGYAALAAALGRVFWGFAGGGYARFSQFARGPAETFAYTRRLFAGTEPRYVGHNPLGGWMVIALLVCIAALGFTGWLYTATDRFWGEVWLDRLHGFLGWLLLALVAIHVAGVVFTSLRHRDDLVAAMIDGRKAGEDQSIP